ncbi:MAG: aminotransferase class I/II-fold pyridoxal phosphate-dependent enzyme [Gemmatimonadaceae bacterium]|nr:aminotransferase class I/II-fold pyridoxal phosphate-dependent enzyme [Gemmatimonadaceae bacterium]
MTAYLDSIPPYVFWELDARRAALRQQGRRLIDLGIGSPDQPIPELVLDAMQRAVREPQLSGYPYFRIHPDFGAAVASYMARRFSVTLDPGTELLALAGSKEGIAELVLAHVGPGDAVLIPAVHYPVYARAPQLAGARVVCVPLDDDGRMRLEDVPASDIACARVMIVNYPSNPTTATVSLDELGRLVAFARAHKIVLVSDLAYSELSYDGFRVPSVLQVEGAREVAVEMHTCSKSFNMAGVRIAFMAGCRRVIDRVDQYRTNIGYGVSTLAQRAGESAFTHAEQLVPPIVAEYKARRDTIVTSFQQAGWPVVSPKGSMYLWLRVPTSYTDWGWVDALMQGPGVVVTPGIAFGDAGRGYFRISFVRPAPDLAEGARRIAALAFTSPVPAP